jgi:hypothetical protein
LLEDAPAQAADPPRTPVRAILRGPAVPPGRQSRIVGVDGCVPVLTPGCSGGPPTFVLRCGARTPTPAACRRPPAAHVTYGFAASTLLEFPDVPNTRPLRAKFDPGALRTLREARAGKGRCPALKTLCGRFAPPLCPGGLQLRIGQTRPLPRFRYELVRHGIGKAAPGRISDARAALISLSLPSLNLSIAPWAPRGGLCRLGIPLPGGPALPRKMRGFVFDHAVPPSPKLAASPLLRATPLTLHFPWAPPAEARARTAFNPHNAAARLMMPATTSASTYLMPGCGLRGIDVQPAGLSSDPNLVCPDAGTAVLLPGNARVLSAIVGVMTLRPAPLPAMPARAMAPRQIPAVSPTPPGLYIAQPEHAAAAWQPLPVFRVSLGHAVRNLRIGLRTARPMTGERLLYPLAGHKRRPERPAGRPARLPIRAVCPEATTARIPAGLRMEIRVPCYEMAPSGYRFRYSAGACPSKTPTAKRGDRK